MSDTESKGLSVPEDLQEVYTLIADFVRQANEIKPRSFSEPAITVRCGQPKVRVVVTMSTITTRSWQAGGQIIIAEECALQNIPRMGASNSHKIIWVALCKSPARGQSLQNVIAQARAIAQHIGYPVQFTPELSGSHKPLSYDIEIDPHNNVTVLVHDTQTAGQALRIAFSVKKAANTTVEVEYRGLVLPIWIDSPREKIRAALGQAGASSCI